MIWRKSASYDHRCSREMERAIIRPVPMIVEVGSARSSQHSSYQDRDGEKNNKTQRNQVLLLPIIASDEPPIIASVEPPIIASVAVAAAAAKKQPETTLQISSSISP
ncbi:hypothetical protein L6452_03004 [Arctium lappa]|uniref:Uncharacterized protein n=1 Tax=Arctium lappa TaxID=4217 RepID=A0ACB9FM05_ARCLA|nr:hypothetical protein L6452_03004 [Arctium lappa]